MRETKDADGGDRAPFLEGGSHPMHGKVGVGTQQPGKGSQEGTGPLSTEKLLPEVGPPGAGFYASGSTNKDYAGTQTPGISSPTKSGGNSKFAEGGKHSTLGNRGSLPSRAGHSTTG